MTPHDRLRARIAGQVFERDCRVDEGAGVVSSDEFTDAILRAVLEEVEGMDHYEHGPRYVVLLYDLRALLAGDGAGR